MLSHRVSKKKEKSHAMGAYRGVKLCHAIEHFHKSAKGNLKIIKFTELYIFSLMLENVNGLI